MNKLDELVKLTHKNTAEAERISKRLDTLNKEMSEKIYKNMEGKA